MAQALYAKTCFTFELAKRLEGTGVTAVAFHPGFVKSNLAQHLPWYLRVMTKLTDIWAKDECEIGVYLAAAREVEKTTGVFFNANKQIVPIHEKWDEAAGRKLWSISVALTGISALQPQINNITVE